MKYHRNSAMGGLFVAKFMRKKYIYVRTSRLLSINGDEKVGICECLKTSWLEKTQG